MVYSSRSHILPPGFSNPLASGILFAFGFHHGAQVQSVFWKLLILRNKVFWRMGSRNRRIRTFLDFRFLPVDCEGGDGKEALRNSKPSWINCCRSAHIILHCILRMSKLRYPSTVGSGIPVSFLELCLEVVGPGYKSLTDATYRYGRKSLAFLDRV
jgi:hypothetical protein